MDELKAIEDVSVLQNSGSKHWKAYSTIAGGTIYMMYVGGLYITGNIQTYC